MPLNYNLSPAGRKIGKRLRDNPLPIALMSPTPDLTPAENAPETQARKVIRKIRNREGTVGHTRDTNIDIAPAEVQELMLASNGQINLTLLNSRKSYAAKYHPQPTTPYCNPSCGCEVGSQGHPSPTSSNYHAGHPSLPIPSPDNPEFVRQCGKSLNELIDLATPDWKWHEYRDTRDKQLVAFMVRRNSHLASLTPDPQHSGCQFGESSKDKDRIPNLPHPTSRFKSYTRRRNIVQLATMSQWRASHRADWENADHVEKGFTHPNESGQRTTNSEPIYSPYIQPALQLSRVQARRAEPVIWQIATKTTMLNPKEGIGPQNKVIERVLTIRADTPLLRDGEGISDRLVSLGGKARSKKVSESLYYHDRTKQGMDDIASLASEVKEQIAARVAGAIMRVNASELTDNWMVISKNLSDGSTKVLSASTSKSAEFKAKLHHAKHPNTANTVVSRVQFLAARMDSVLSQPLSE